jgi:quercetin dioxygenase-like cupin family protein
MIVNDNPCWRSNMTPSPFFRRAMLATTVSVVVALPARSAQDPIASDPKHISLELENDKVRIFRTRVGPRESVPMHDHVLDAVSVYLTDLRVKVTTATGEVEDRPGRAGQVSYFPGGRHHRIENVLDTPYELIEIEIKVR